MDEYIYAANKKPGEFLFSGRRGLGRCITTGPYPRLVSEWIASIGLDPTIYSGSTIVSTGPGRPAGYGNPQNQMLSLRYQPCTR
jgi:hypothetical protein